VQSVDLDDVDQDGRNGFQEYLESINLLPESSMFLKYSKMFMVTLQTLFAIDPFQGDTLAEIWFGVLTLFISVCLHATFVSFIIEIMESMNKAQSSLEQRINSVTSFLRMNGIDGDLRNDVLDYFEFRFANSNDQDNDNRILDSLPTELQSRIIKRIFPRAIESAYIFSACNESFVSKLVIKMSRNQQRTMPNQIITAQGSLEEQMYLLKSGSAEVKVTDERGFAVSLMNIHSGQVFGELSLWMECRRTATVKSTKFCQVFILTRVDLVDVLKSYPGMEVVIATHALAAALRVEELCPGLSGISTNTSERLGKRMADQCREFEDGEVLISEGQPADEAWIVRTGKVTTEVCGGKLALFQEQRCVGFTSLFCERPHQECVRAKGPTLAYRLTRHDVDEIFVDDPLTLKALRRSCTRNYKATGQRNTFLRWHFVSNCLTSLSSNQAIRKSSSFTGFADGLRRTLDTGDVALIFCDPLCCPIRYRCQIAHPTCHASTDTARHMACRRPWSNRKSSCTRRGWGWEGRKYGFC
jgi:CRP-like cAMP-binding protein